MKDTYELHIGGLIKPSDNFQELQSLAHSSSDPYEIYLVKQSAMNRGFKGYKQHRKVFTDVMIEKAIELLARGRIQKDIAKQMHTTSDTLSRAIRNYKLENA